MSNVKRLSIVVAVLLVVVVASVAIALRPVAAATVCTPATAITVPYTKDGVGDVCLQATSLCGYVNSWNLTTLEINGTAYTNVYIAGSSVAPLNGGYTIHYVSTVAWGHMEIAGTCGAPVATTVVPPVATTAVPPVATKTFTPVTPGGATATRTRTATTGPTATRTNTVPPGQATATRTSTVPPVATTAVPPANTATRTPTTPPTGPTPTNPPAGTHLADPFAGINLYVNPYWQGSTKGYSVNTSIWLDTNMAVDGTAGYPKSINGWMDAALAAGKNAISIVVYNLPGRDCAALASNGLLPATEAGLTTYKTVYIDPIAAAAAAHPTLRVIAIIEPDSLPNLVTNLSDPDCSSVNSQTLYQRGTTYTLSKFETVPNIYSYLDIGHAGWLGWPSNFNPAITLISNVIKAACAACSDGFADGTANTQVETETFLDAQTSVGGNPVRSSAYFDWNDYIDESHYATAWKAAMASAGIAGNTMVLDTSRNGWGGCGGGPYALQTCRPTKTSTSTDLNTYVNESRIDRRPAKGDWCNQNGAGLGKLPGPGTAPYAYYLWIKPPAESDGSSSLIPVGTENPDGKGFDQMCDPNYGGNSLNQNKNSNALPNAPVSGRWFQAQWDQLVANKFP